MGDVKLRVNMILEGHFFRFGSLLDEKKIPLHLRKRRYILRPGERDIDEIRFRAQASVAENGDGDVVDAEDVTIDEGNGPKIMGQQQPVRRRVIRQ